MKTIALLLVSFCLPVLASPALAQVAPSPAASVSPSIPPPSPKHGVYPIAYRELITRWLSDRLADPASAKIEFSEPVPSEVKQKGVRASGYSVDFRVNSRNKFGMYTGFQKYRVLIRNGEIIWADRAR